MLAQSEEKKINQGAKCRDVAFNLNQMLLIIHFQGKVSQKLACFYHVWFIAIYSGHQPRPCPSIFHHKARFSMGANIYNDRYIFFADVYSGCDFAWLPAAAVRPRGVGFDARGDPSDAVTASYRRTDHGPPLLVSQLFRWSSDSASLLRTAAADCISLRVTDPFMHRWLQPTRRVQGGEASNFRGEFRFQLLCDRLGTHQVGTQGGGQRHNGVSRVKRAHCYEDEDDGWGPGSILRDFEAQRTPRAHFLCDQLTIDDFFPLENSRCWRHWCL